MHENRRGQAKRFHNCKAAETRDVKSYRLSLKNKLSVDALMMLSLPREIESYQIMSLDFRLELSCMN